MTKTRRPVNSIFAVDIRNTIRGYWEFDPVMPAWSTTWPGGTVRVVNNGIGATIIEHVAIIVTDLNRARDFYGRVLGLVEVPRPESFDFPGTWYQVGNTCLHLLGKPIRDTDSSRHFCMRVPDLPTAERHLKTVGWPCQWQTKHKIIGIDRFFLHDPDGNRIEVQGPELGTLNG